MKYLRDYKHYEDYFEKYLKRKLSDFKVERKSGEDSYVVKCMHKFFKGMYKRNLLENKEKLIDSWMEQDRKKDILLVTTLPPKKAKCVKCKGKLRYQFNYIHSGTTQNNMDVGFVMTCEVCGYLNVIDHKEKNIIK